MPLKKFTEIYTRQMFNFRIVFTISLESLLIALAPLNLGF
ncbi:hypothetical protein DSM02_2519 [Leeuwenhoekiella polynyae]|uniref:Uncharacterized protein n=1 Tax=Leeuwenhoekiella polynyae TaxID=1550906 RepID=A0A4Q0P2T2_9FLAO|nr:hypothetical protein DSM02_2519 [Leeuwenhoekiella polynyae]